MTDPITYYRCRFCDHVFRLDEAAKHPFYTPVSREEAVAAKLAGLISDYEVYCSRHCPGRERVLRPLRIGRPS